jgi:C4-dicarboxylate transporter DctM subunit
MQPPSLSTTSWFRQVSRLAKCRVRLPRETLDRLENLVCTGALLLMAVLPLLEILLRAVFSAGIPGSALWTQHLVLWVAFFGAAIAAREGRLLALATEALLPAGLARWGRPFAAGLGLAVCAAAMLGGISFVLAERQGGQTVVFGIPVWALQVVIPLGFAVLALRLWAKGADGWRGLVTSTSAPLLLLAVTLMPDLFHTMGFTILLVIAVAFGAAMGAPIFVVLGGVAAVLLWSGYEPISAIPVEIYNLTVKPLLPTIPLFTLAGYILAAGGTPRRLVALFRAVFGWAPGGVAVVAILACAFFTSFTGGSGVTIVALGGLLYPMLIQEQYRDKLTTGLLTSAGSLGLLLPPSLAVILYSVVAQVDIRRLFAAGVLPAGVEVVIVIGFVILFARRHAVSRTSFAFREALAALRDSAWEVAIPVLVLTGLLGGFTTLVETSAVTVLYALVLEFGIRRELSLRRDLLRVVAEASTLIGGVLLILGVAMGMTNYLIIEEIPLLATTWVQNFVQSPLAFLLLLNVFLLIVGCLMDIYSAITVMVPLLTPIGLAFGIDPLQLGVIFLINLELGYLTPPVGMNLFLAAYRFDRRLDEVYRAALPFLGIRAVAVILVTYVPPLTLWLPAWLELAG